MHCERQKLNGDLTPIERIGATVLSYLGYQHRSAWDMSLYVVSALFGNLGESSAILMASTVKALGNLQSVPDEDTACCKQLHSALGPMVSAVDSLKFLAIPPLEMDREKLTDCGPWLLSTLKHHIV